jgi:shikimate dehydrogenase
MPWQVDKETQLFLSASSRPSRFGATIYNELFRFHRVNAVYLSRAVTDAKALATAIRTLDVRGCSVSMPMKSQIIEHLYQLDGEAERVRSVNTVLNQEGRLIGHNTDLHGVKETLRTLTFSSVLVYGSGSVVDSILHSLNGATVFVEARNPERRREVSEQWFVPEYQGEPVDLFINATPLSLEPLPESVRKLLSELRPQVFDLVVPRDGNHLEAYARELGLGYVPGFTMYQHQFVKQFELYTGIAIEPGVVEQIAKERGLI